MPEVVSIWNAFNAGELSRFLDGRTDQQKYFLGCRVLENFLPSVQGPAIRRAGTRYVGSTKGNGRAWLVPFQFSTVQSYILEFGDQYIRFWTNRGQLLSAGVPYEISTPWTWSDLINAQGFSTLRFAQAGDTMWITLSSGTKQPMKLQRLGATNWTLTAVSWEHGPFEDVDKSQTISVSASGTTGTITLTATAACFSAEHVGRLIYLEAENLTVHPAWQASVAAPLNSIVRYEGNYYQATTNVGTGSQPPTHLYGKASDGNATWQYIHSGYGYALITAVSSGTSATATVVSDGVIGRTLPTDIVTSGTKKWAMQAYNSVKGWPVDVTFFKNRLAYIKGYYVDLSVVGSYDDFARKDGAQPTSETAVRLKLAVKRLDAVRWFEQGKALIIGTSQGEIAVLEQTTQKVFAADNVQASPQTSYGAPPARAVRVNEAVLFPQRGARRIREMKYDAAADNFAAEDLNALAHHILKAQVCDMDFALEPDTALWCVLRDGRCASLTYNRERGVAGWSRHYVGGRTASTAWGLVQAVSVISSPSEDRDDVWFVVEREVNGSTVRYVEFLEDYDTAALSGIEDAFFVDAGVTYSGAATTTITGLGHLEGETVSVLADGSPHADCVVSSGSITLNRPSTKVHVGLAFRSTLQTMRPDAGANNGTGQTRVRSISDVRVRLDNTVGGKVGPSVDKLTAIPYRNPSDTLGAVLQPFTGDKRVTPPANSDTDGYVTVVQDQPLPMTVVAIVLRMSVDG